MFVQRLPIPVTTDAGGAATVYSDVATGRIATIVYVKDGSNGFSNGSTITCTLEATGESVWAESNVNASATRAPRQATHTIAGAAALYASGGTAVNDQIAMANDRLKIVIASGGATKVGTFYLVLN